MSVANTPQAWSGRAERPFSWDAAGWSERGQKERFAAALGYLSFEPADRVLDFGCGTGALLDWLPEWVHYYGVDWAKGMLERGSAEHPESSSRYGRHFIDYVPEGGSFSHVVAIGPFNLPGSVMRTSVQIQRLWASASKTLVVSLYRGDDTRCLRYTPRFAAEVARDCGCRRFVIDASYLDNDLMLVMRR